MANSEPRVSIGMPVYNGENYLAQALDSLLAQTFTDFEIVICGNASTDGTEALCREYAERDARIVYRRNESNVGAAANFNKVFGGSLSRWGVDAANATCPLTERGLGRTRKI